MNGMKRLLWSGSLLGVLIRIAAGDGGPQELAFADAVRMMLHNNRSIAMARKELEGSGFHVQRTMRDLYPVLSMAAQSNYSERKPYSGGGSEQIEVIPGVKIPADLLSAADQKYYGSSVGLSMGEAIFDKRILARITLARTEQRIAQLNLSIAEKEAMDDLIDKYFALLDVEEHRAFMKRKMDYYQELLNVAQAKVKRGEAGPLLEMDAEINRKLARSEASRLDKEKNRLQAELFAVLGIEPLEYVLNRQDAAFAVVSSSATIDWVDAGLKNSEELHKVDLTIVRTRQEITLAHAENIPAIGLDSNVNWYKNNPDFANTFDRFDRSWSLGLKVDWRFFDSGRAKKLNSDGCFRCHDGLHKSPDGKVLTNDCSACHQILTQGSPSEVAKSRLQVQPFKHPVDLGVDVTTMKCSTCHTGTTGL